MDILKRELAPLSREAWQEIDERAKEVLKSRLTARRVVKVVGPKGWEFNAVDEGRLENIQEGEICTGTYKVKPLVEARINFTLDRWELDNITRGAKDVDYTGLERAAKKLADFEEDVVYNGYSQGNIQGLSQSSAHESIPFGDDEEAIMNAIIQGMDLLKENYDEGPYVLVVGKEAWRRLHVGGEGYPLMKRLKSLLDGRIVQNNTIQGAFLIPYDNENLELTIGQDFSIGYQSHNDDEVRLFITESFTFRVLDENLIVQYTV